LVFIMLFLTDLLSILLIYLWLQTNLILIKTLINR
jgi:hypothetical protein